MNREPDSYPFIISAKTVRIDSKLYGKSYDWSKATAYLDNGSIKMSVHNEWSAQEKANPLAGKVISINKGETVTFTFEVKEDPLAACPVDIEIRDDSDNLILKIANNAVPYT